MASDRRYLLLLSPASHLVVMGLELLANLNYEKFA